MSSNTNPKEARAARGTTVPGDARREPDPPQVDMPEWLAKELFKIFV